MSPLQWLHHPLPKEWVSLCNFSTIQFNGTYCMSIHDLLNYVNCIHDFNNNSLSLFADCNPPPRGVLQVCIGQWFVIVMIQYWLGWKINLSCICIYKRESKCLMFLKIWMCKVRSLILSLPLFSLSFFLHLILCFAIGHFC